MGIRFITCASYYGTGSSAITDLVSEYAGVVSMTNEEFRFLQDPDGVDDLYYHLVVNHNRHNSGHAVKRFKRLVDFYAGNVLSKKYSPFFHGRWKEISYAYIEDLVDFTYPGWWIYDLIDGGKWFHFRKRIINFILRRTVWRDQPERTFNSMKKEITYCAAPDENRFVDATKRYIRELFTEAAGTADATVMVDQIVPPSNVDRYTRYFDDIVVVVVDRDPRDLYALAKTRWRDGVIPCDRVEDFIQWFLYTRKHRSKEIYDPQVVRLVQFERLVYEYENTVAELETFLDLKASDHIRVGEGFNPAVSIGNTRVWCELPELAADIRQIEEVLADFIYEIPEDRR